MKTLPGSSLKGLFRSAILSRLVEEEGDGRKVVDECIRNLLKTPHNEIKPKYAANPIAETMLGKDAKYNLMRSLTVSDCALPANAVQVDEAFVTRIVAGGRQFQRKNWNILIERVRPGESATGQISFDQYLQEQAKGKLAFNFRATLTLEWLLDALHRRTERFLTAELNFLVGKNGDGVQKLRSFYTTLQQKTSRLDATEAIVQFAWGSGWKAMTGELLQPTQNLRSKLRLATNYLDFPFPKSRRLVGKGESAQPIGWVKLTFKEKGENSRSVTSKTVDPRQALLSKIEAVQNWDDLKKMAAPDSGFADNHACADVAEAFKVAALRVKANYPKTWEDDRDRLVHEWLAPSGLDWSVKTGQTDGNTVPQSTSTEPNRVLEAAFTDFNNWQQRHVQLGLAIENIPTLPEAESLHRLFVTWGLHGEKPKSNKGKVWKQLKAHIKALQSASA